MGADQAVTGQKAEVVELLPSAAYRLRLENEETVMAHAAGSGVRILCDCGPAIGFASSFPPRDKTRGRIVNC